MTVVAIGGSASVGKTTLARDISDRLHLDNVIHVDDVRGPSFIETTANVWTKPATWLVEALITETERVHASLVETIDEISATSASTLIEGEGLEPRLLRRWPSSVVQPLYVIENDPVRLHESFARRSSGARFLALSPAEQAAVVEMNHAYGLWLRDEAEATGQAWISSRPWPTRADRALATIAVTA